MRGKFLTAMLAVGVVGATTLPARDGRAEPVPLSDMQLSAVTAAAAPTINVSLPAIGIVTQLNISTQVAVATASAVAVSIFGDATAFASAIAQNAVSQSSSNNN